MTVRCWPPPARRARKIRLLPEPSFAIADEQPARTIAEDAAKSASGWLAASTAGLADTGGVEHLPTLAGAYAAELGGSARAASQALQPQAVSNQPTVADAGAASAAAAMAAFAGSATSPVIAVAKPAPLPQPAATVAAVAPPAAPGKTAEVPARSQATAVPDKPDPKLAERAATMADQVSKGATDILSKLPPEQPKPGQPADAGAARAAQAPIAEVPSAPESNHPLTIASARFTGQGAAAGLLSLSGRGEPGRPVALYLDDSRLGATVTSTEGQWRLEAITRVAMGQHTARADLTPAPGRPAESAVLVFSRNPPVAAGAQSPIATIASGTKTSPPPPSKPVVAQAAPAPAPKPQRLASAQKPPQKPHSVARPRVVYATAAAKPLRRATPPADQGNTQIVVRVFRGKHQIIVRVPFGYAAGGDE